MDAEVESVMASSQDQREEELQVNMTKLVHRTYKISQSYCSITSPIFFRYWTRKGQIIPYKHS